MANHRNQGVAAAPKRGPQATSDQSAPRTVIHEFDVPDDDGLWNEQTQDFGSIRTFGLRLLTPLQEKYAAQAAKGDPLLLAFELCRRAVAYVKSDVGGGTEDAPNIQQFSVGEQDGSSNALWAQMNPRLRTLAMQANADISVPNERTQIAFLASRRILA